MKILQINTVSNSRSTGKIAEGIGEAITKNGWNSYVASGKRLSGTSTSSHQIFIGDQSDYMYHAIASRLFDAQGLLSVSSTKDFLVEVDEIQPDLIHLHNLHGYYLNYELLFNYLAETNIPVVWTLHDCWAFTGHCAHYSFSNCHKWQHVCYSCPEKRSYPASFTDFSTRNFNRKKDIFNSLQKLTICTPSKWLEQQVRNSFLGNYEIRIINNGVDLNIFKPASYPAIRTKLNIDNRQIILGVASTWSERKGFNDFLKLNRHLNSDKFQIVLVGLTEKQQSNLPKNIIGILRTENQVELAQLYSEASFFFNPTYEDTFPTTNIESLACGAPVITYNTGGSPEIIDENTGWIVECGDLKKAASIIENNQNENRQHACRTRAQKVYDQKKLFNEYINLYKQKLNQ